MSLGERMHSEGYEVLIAQPKGGYVAYLKGGGKIMYSDKPPVRVECGLQWVRV